MLQKEVYEAPQLVVVSFRVENGFAASSPMSSLLFWELGESNQVESYETHDLWNDENDGFWQ